MGHLMSLERINNGGRGVADVYAAAVIIARIMTSGAFATMSGVRSRRGIVGLRSKLVAPISMRT